MVEPMNIEEMQLRFDSKYIPVTESGCWLWEAYVSPNGYGTFSVEGKTQGAHRVSYFLHKGEIPTGAYVLHKCDNTICVNPEHLFLGTQLDNMKDMAKKGRRHSPNHKGELHPNTKLSTEDVICILKDGVTPMPSLALLFGVSYDTIYKIKKRVTWKHIKC